MGWCVERAIQSVLDQQIDGVEIIVVDDGSTDDTLARLQNFRGRIVTISQSNRGLSAARNSGIKRAAGEFLAFLDADDRFRARKLELQRSFLRGHADCGAVFSDGYLVSLEGETLNLISAESPRGLFAEQSASRLRRLLYRGHPFPPHAALLRRSCAIAVGLFDESMRAREDLDFWLRFSEAFPICYLPGALVDYTVRTNSLSRTSDLMYSQSCGLYDRLLRSTQFGLLPRAEKASSLRAWALEVGVQHHGPWAGADSRAHAYASEALRLVPWDWRNWAVNAILSSRFSIQIARRLMQYRLSRGRNRFAAARARGGSLTSGLPPPS